MSTIGILVMICSILANFGIGMLWVSGRKSLDRFIDKYNYLSGQYMEIVNRPATPVMDEAVPLRSKCPGCGHHASYHNGSPGGNYIDTGCNFQGVKFLGRCSCAASRHMVEYYPESMTKIV